MFHSIWHLQLAWILPTMTLMVLGCAVSLIAANTATGAMAVGLIWIVEVKVSICR